ncbi:MAG: hypothetical protein RLY31_1888 [Bacteroidota bacterium]
MARHDRRHSAGNGREGDQSLTRKAGIFTISRALTISSQLLGVVVLTRVLSEQDAGLVFFLLTIYSTAQSFGQLGLPDSVFYFFEKLAPEYRRSFVQLIGRTLAWLGVAGAVVMLGIAWVGATREGFGDLRRLIWALMVLLLFELPTLPLPNVLIALNRSREAAWLNLFSGLTQFLAMVIPLAFPEPVRGITFGLLAYGFLRMMASAWLLRKHLGVSPSVRLPNGTLRSVFAYSIPLSLAQLLWGLNRQVDKYVVQWFLPGAFTVYTAGAYEIPIVPTIAYSIAAVMMPQLVSHFLQGDRGAMLSLWLRSIRKVSLLVLPLVMVFIVAAEEFIALLFPENYAAAVVPFRIYTLVMLQRVASYSNMQKALDRTGDITRGAVYLFLLNLVLSVPFVRWWGPAGPPLASLVANLFVWWYALDRIGRALQVPWWKTFPFRDYGRVLALAMLAGLPAWAAKGLVEWPAGWGFLSLAALYGMTYLFFGRLTGLIPASDWHRLLRPLYGRRR